MLILRRLIVALAGFTYTLMYGLAFSRFAFNSLARLDRYGVYIVSSTALENLRALTTIMLHISLVIIVIFMYEKIRGSMIFAYLASLLASFFMPLIFVDMRSRGFITFSWQFDGIIWSVVNLILGPAMVMLLSYLTVKLVKRLNRHNTNFDKPGGLYEQQNREN